MANLFAAVDNKASEGRRFFSSHIRRSNAQAYVVREQWQIYLSIAERIVQPHNVGSDIMLIYSISSLQR